MSPLSHLVDDQPHAEQIGSFIEGMLSFDGHDRRADARYTLFLPITVTMVDDNLQPIAAPMTMIARDISAGGISLLYKEPIRAKHLLIDLNNRGHHMQLVLEVLRIRTMSDWCHECAGRFVPWRREER